MRSFLILLLMSLLAMTVLSGCAELLIDSPGDMIAAGADDAPLAVGVGSTDPIAPVRIEVSSELERLPSQQGTLSNGLSYIVRRWRMVKLEPGGILRADGEILARINPDDGAIQVHGSNVGYISRKDGFIYENVRNSSPQAVGILDGFVSENGVELTTNLNGTTGVEVLRSKVIVRVTAIANGRYLISLPNGASGWVPASTLTLMILAVGQQNQDCPDNGPGAIIRKSGEEILFLRCRRIGGAFVLDTPAGTVVVDVLDVDSILTGNRVPGIQMLYASNQTPIQTEVDCKQPSGEESMSTLSQCRDVGGVSYDMP